MCHVDAKHLFVDKPASRAVGTTDNASKHGLRSGNASSNSMKDVI